MLKIHRSDLHFSSLNGVNVTPNQSTIVSSVGIDTIQVALPTGIVPPGSSYQRVCGTVYGGCVVILIFCREFMAIMITQIISSGS